MATIVERAQAYKDESLNLYKQAQSKLDEYEGKEMPIDVMRDADRLFDEGKRKSDMADLAQKAAEAEKWKELPNDLKRLETPQGKLKPEEGNEFQWDEVMRKYGLRRWQVKDVKSSISSIDRAFKHSLEMLRSSGGIEIKAISNIAEGLSTSGSTLTPDIFVPEFVQKLYLMSHLRGAGARIVPLRSDITRYPKMSTASAAAQLVTESSAVTTSNATYGEQAFTAYMFRALQQASIEIVADAEFDLLSEIILPDMAQQFAAAENSYFTVGVASALQPEGIVTGIVAGSGNTIPTTVGWATSASIGFDDVINLMHQPPPQYRAAPNNAFMGNDSVIKTLRKVKAVSAGTYIWEPSQQVGVPDTIYGKPVYYNQSMTTAVSAGTFPLLYGCMDYFWIGDRMGLDVRTAQELYLVNAQIGYFGFKRVDSHVMQNEAFAILKGT